MSVHLSEAHVNSRKEIFTPSNMSHTNVQNFESVTRVFHTTEGEYIHMLVYLIKSCLLGKSIFTDTNFGSNQVLTKYKKSVVYLSFTMLHSINLV